MRPKRTRENIAPARGRAERHLTELMWVSTGTSWCQDDMTREMLTAETVEHAAARMNVNMLTLSGFEHGKFAAKSNRWHCFSSQPVCPPLQTEQGERWA